MHDLFKTSTTTLKWMEFAATWYEVGIEKVNNTWGFANLVDLSAEVNLFDLDR